MVTRLVIRHEIQGTFFNKGEQAVKLCAGASEFDIGIINLEVSEHDTICTNGLNRYVTGLALKNAAYTVYNQQ
jgi:hypothetical protein